MNEKPISMVDFANALLAGPARCSWCDAEMNLKPEPGSHGICKRHRAEEEARFATWLALDAVEDVMAMEAK